MRAWREAQTEPGRAMGEAMSEEGEMIRIRTSTSEDRLARLLAGVAVSLVLVAGLAPRADAQIVSNFDALMDLVADFENGLEPDVVTAQCSTPDVSEATPTRPFEPVDELTCTEGSSPVVGSGWDIMRGCFAAFEDGTMVVGFRQSGLAGDNDGDGDPNVGSFQFDINGIGSREGYDVTLDSDFVGLAEFQVSVTDVDVGGHSTADRGPSEGLLCLVEQPGLSTPPVAGPESIGCLNGPIGLYRAGTTGSLQPAGGALASDEVLIQVNDIRNLPAGRSLDPRRLRLTLQASSQEVGDTCAEDTTTFLAVGASIALEKSASGSCSAQQFELSARYEVRNDGLQDFDAAELVDEPATNPSGLLSGPPTCTVDGTPVGVEDLGGGAFRALLGELPASDFDAIEGDPFPSLSDNDCGNDGILDPACGRAVVECAWAGIPIADIDQVEFDNDAAVDGLVGTVTRASAEASASAVALRTPACEGGGNGGDGSMRKEHEGVGFDDALSLTETLPFGGGAAFGSNVEPGGLPDVDAREGFVAQGAVEVIGSPGVWANLPRIPPGKGLRPQFGSRAVFTWTMLVTGDVSDVANLDVACSLCSEKAWRTDRAPGQTFVPELPDEDSSMNGFVISNQAVMLSVNHICGPIHGPGPCGGAMSSVGIPGLERRPTSVLGANFVTFLGCKPTVVQLDPLSSGDPILPGDLVEVQVTVPENERTRVFADATSCEAAYLTTTAKPQP